MIGIKPRIVTVHQRRNQGTLSAGTRAVVRRYEIYQYTGAYDPITHQALCADVACVAPQDGELGDFVGAQMAAANVGIPAVTVNKTGSGSVSSVDRIISCGNKCTAAYNLGTQVTLTASPSSGNAFTGWTGACTGSNATCTITVNEALNVGATFVPAFTLSIARSGKGVTTSNLAGINCGGGGDCSVKFAQGTRIILTATPPAGAQFLNWTGGCSGTTPTCSLTITKDTQVQAIFSK